MPTQIEPALLVELREQLRRARRVFVLTGAGACEVLPQLEF
ncbi:MAG TPA: hypothetical protein VGW12_02385 [Pyrinomonadaceae bacterium]|nr:hypothetical protein [Pyrinomonadaceae bacterium]